MSKIKKRIVYATLLLLSLASLAWLFLYTQILKPRQQFEDLHELTIQGKHVSDDEWREAAHKSLRWTSNHDAFLTLGVCGDDTSIPVLIRSLRRIPKESRESGIIGCTWEHCRDALVSITGEDFGYDPELWQEWYDKHTERT